MDGKRRIARRGETQYMGEGLQPFEGRKRNVSSEEEP